MEKFITDERTGLCYELVGDYYLIAGEDEPEGRPIGVWGQRHLRYIRKHKVSLYAELLTTGKLNDYLADLNEQAEAMFSRLVKQLSEKEGVTEALKAENQMLWVQRMNNIRSAAMESVANDLIYRTNGSIDIAGAARSILAVTRTANKQNPAERYLVQVKSNLAPMGSAILFEVADKGVNFLDELELSAEDAFSASAPRMGRPNAREEAATDFIRSLLAGGRRLASDCEAKLEAAGFKKSTYKKSKKKAGVRSVKDGFFWYWTLPEVEKPIENGQEVTDEDDLPI